MTTYEDYIKKYERNDMVEISVKPKRLDVQTIKNVKNMLYDTGSIHYSSKSIPYIYSSVPIKEVTNLRDNNLISEVNITDQYEFHNITSAQLVDTTQNTLNSEAVNSTKINQLWDEGLTGKNIKIAIIDSGIDTNHPMFTDSYGISKIIKMKSFSTESIDDILGHGTFVASCASGYEWDTDIGTLYGASPDSKLIIAKVSKGSFITTANVTAAIDWIFTPENDGGAGGADIIQMSIGSLFLSKDKIQLLKYATDNGAIPICSIGNSGPSYSTVSFPGGLSNVIGVGSIGLKTPNYNEAATFSSRGPGHNVNFKPDFLAPGGNKFIESRLEDNIGGDENIIGACPLQLESKGYMMSRGTSFSSPIVSGIIACLREKYTFKNIYSNVIKNNDSGFGLIDAISLNNQMENIINSISKEVIAKKQIKINNHDPWIADNATNPSPYYINNKLYIYHVNEDFTPTSVNLTIYDNNTYTNYISVTNGMTPPGIVLVNDVYYAFYAVYSNDTYKIVRSESTDGIIWTNQVDIITLNEHVFGIDIIYFNDNFIIYYDTVTSVTKGKAAPIMYIEYDITSNTILESGIALEPSTTPPYDTYIISNFHKPKCYIENDKVIMITSGTILRPWYLTTSESDDGKTFTLTNIITTPFDKDYNYYNGYCLGTIHDKKYYYSNGTFLDYIMNGTILKIYIS